MNWVTGTLLVSSDPLKQREVSKIVKRCDLSLLCLVETRVRADKIQDIHLLSGWSFEFCNSNQGLGEIWLV
jgi:hypothetical protein